jgi:prepilin-type processing-associated H-X9-DG protein
VLRRVFPLLFLIVAAGALFILRPSMDDFTVAPDDGSTRACQGSLRHIGQAFAQYAQDWDGTFPRGVDPEDRAPQTWREGYGGQYFADAQNLLLLPEVLAPYLEDRNVWHCPADVGWAIRREGFTSRLTAVQPSSWEKFGTSYYYYTIHGFAGLKADDFPNAAREVVLFDGDFWHDRRQSLNALFADGHVENLSPHQFDQLGEEETRNLSSIRRGVNRR